MRNDGALVGGNTTLYTVDPVSGVPTAIAAGLGDLRGAEPWQSATHAFGSGCSGGSGPITLTASLTPQPGALLSLRSSNHEANGVGLLLVGFGNTSFGALPLPLSLDRLFGTVGCTLYTTLDITALGTTTSSPPATMSFAITLPPVLDVFTFYAQHLALENVPGGMSTANAIAVQVGP